MFIRYSIIFISLLITLSSCEKAARDNPWDAKADPDAWAPKNFSIEDISITSKKLTWEYASDEKIEGFKLDRKKGDEPWQPGLQTFTKETRSWNDTDIIPDLALTYSYLLYAYVGKNVSSEKSITADAAIPSPTNLQVMQNSITSITLNWQSNSTGEEGFRIERKQGTGNWKLISTLSEISYTDEAFDLNTVVVYQIAAYYEQYYSDFAENSFNSQIPPPENLTITANSLTSVTLNWGYNHTGHDGFKIERKIDNGSWVMLADNLNPSQNSFTDDGIDLNSYTYHYRVFSSIAGYNSDKAEQSITFIFTCGEKLTDWRDGNEYETVQIGNQCWMRENLKWLPSVSPASNISSTSAYYYVYGYQGSSVNDAKATANYQTYGVLYNWPAALNACPDGWHLPSDSEWTVLVDYLGGSSVAGGKMKTTGTTHWKSPNTGATNSSGFSGLPGGDLYTTGTFSDLGNLGYWWSATASPAATAWYRFLRYRYGNVYRSDFSKPRGFSVRCLKE
jgi:uncharacterized protein (TIGR02145 family)